MNPNLRLLFMLLWLPTAFSFGQPTLSVSATISPTLSRTNYQNRYFYPESDGQIVEPVYMHGSRWASGYSAGLSFLYTYAPGWSVSSGIWYGQLTTRQARQPTAGDGTTMLRSRAIRIPILLNYASSRQRLTPYFSFGVLTDIPVSSRVVVTRSGQSTQHLRLERSKRPVFHLLVGAGAQYRLNRHCTLMAQPAWTYKLGQLGEASTNDSSFEVGLLTQVAYTF